MSIALQPRDTLPNYYALAMSILANCTPDHAMLEFQLTANRPTTASFEDDRQTTTMIQMRKEGITYRAIGEWAGISDQATYKRIARWKLRHDPDTEGSEVKP